MRDKQPAMSLHRLRLAAASGATAVQGLTPLGRTIAVRRKVEQASRRIERWLRQCARPVISCSGGKDSTLLVQLVHAIDPSVAVVMADGPATAYLSDQLEHRDRLVQAVGTPVLRLGYDWDHRGWLHGTARYPHELKQRTLRRWIAEAGHDGLALGLRASESRARAALHAHRGFSYRWLDGTHVVLPLADWSAAEVLAVLVSTDRLPLNPVYERTDLQPDWERVRDGTWTPLETADAHGYRAWLARHYPWHVADYDLALTKVAQR